MVIIAGIVVAGAALFVLAPLLGWGALPAFESGAAAVGAQRDQLLRQRQEILAAIKDLDLEFELGKLTREDHQQARERLAAEAFALYGRLDEDPRE
jgi:hypothetical protein